MLGLITLLALAQPMPALPREAAEAITPDRAKATVEALAGFGTRHTLSATDDPARGIGAARNWLKAQFEALPGLEVRLEECKVPPMQRLPDGATLMNVVAVLPGKSPVASGRRFYVVGHYDTINSNRMDPVGDAPGANDDASGTAVVLECARALAGRDLEATVVFLCTAGEEQGLVGARLHAEAAKARGENIVAVLSNDIVGDPSPTLTIPTDNMGMDFMSQPGSGLVRVFSEALPRNLSAEQLAEIRRLGSEHDSPSRQLARYVLTIGSLESSAVRPWLIFRQDRFLRGGDHSAFNDSGFPAVRFTTPAEDYSRQHQNVTEKDGKPYGDVPEFVNGEYVANVARLNAMVLAHLANAPASPPDARLVTAQLTTDTTIRWSRSPDPDVAGYEVMYRHTTSWQWDGAKNCGDATEVTLPISKDNFFFGVRAYDKEGYRSLVTFAGAAGR